MALQDILEGIVAETNEKIEQARKEHQERTRVLRTHSDMAIAGKVQSINDQKEMKKRQMRERTELHGQMVQRNAVLRKEQEKMDALYNGVLDALLKLPAAKIESFLENCLKRIETDGTIHPSKEHADILKKIAGKRFTVGEPIDAKGGFLFVSPTQEHDYTFDFLVREVLRPETEIEAAHTLFA